jgi:hypothetical protein
MALWLLLAGHSVIHLMEQPLDQHREAPQAGHQFALCAQLAQLPLVEMQQVYRLQPDRERQLFRRPQCLARAVVVTVGMWHLTNKEMCTTRSTMMVIGEVGS